ncbi:hypothetical protein [Paraburkholderia hayleyella]|uniref:hypothetical protein n=1 Tax=Paraburkholderia hayleyella TaxID=2152889 RepID=UPI00158006A9|nr:hypothetical protein [Paraburkholderia hayleyella]
MNVCEVTRSDPASGRFSGRVEPGERHAYARSAPLVLLFEALHQFAVKAARQMHGHPALLVPAQLRDVSVRLAEPPLPSRISGEVTCYGSAYRVSIEVCNEADELIAEGKVFVSVLIAGVQS